MSKLDELKLKFYNHNYKVQYLREYENKQRFNARINIFRFLSAYEEKLGKDLGQMTRLELLKAFETYQVSGYSNLIPAMTYLRGYLMWYSNNVSPVPAQNVAISWTDVDLTDCFRKYMLLSTSEIAQDWEKFPPDSGHCVQAVSVLAWHGMSLGDIAELKKSEVSDDGDRIEVSYGDNAFEITDTISLSILRTYASVKSKTTNTRVWVPNKTDRFIYRMYYDTPKEDWTVISLSSHIKSIRANRGDIVFHKYDIPSLVNAGRYFRIIQLENQRGEKLSNDELRKMAGRTSADRQQTSALRKSVDVYRVAFNL